MTRAERTAFRKDVDFVAKDDDQQIATGIVMVPWKVDLQHDWVKPETIEGFAEQFADFESVGQADGGVMHAVWPDDHLSLASQRVLDEAETIGGVEAPAGAWIQEWQFTDDELWSLVEDDILSAYSIGAVDVRWNGPFEQDDLPEEVEVPDEIDEDEWVWELASGIIREVSTVDIPAVPDAMILETKEAYEKRLADHLGNRDGFIEEAMERGHTQAEAERLWDYLNGAVDIEGAGDPGSKGLLASAGKAFLRTLSGGEKTQPDERDAPGPAAKEGRTLSVANRDSLFASIDAGLDVLEDAGVDHGMTRFTDRDDVEFDLTEHAAREWSGDHPDDEGGGEEEEEEAGEEEENASPIDNAAGGETPESGSTDAADDMTENEKNTDPDSDDPMDDAPEWAQSIQDSIEENSKRLDEQNERIEAALDHEEEKTVEIEIGGEVHEVSESEAKSWFEDDGDPFEDAPMWAKALKSELDATDDRIDTIVRQSGKSDQLAGTETGDGEGKEGALDALGEALN